MTRFKLIVATMFAAVLALVAIAAPAQAAAGVFKQTQFITSSTSSYVYDVQYVTYFTDGRYDGHFAKTTTGRCFKDTGTTATAYKIKGTTRKVWLMADCTLPAAYRWR